LTLAIFYFSMRASTTQFYLLSLHDALPISVLNVKIWCDHLFDHTPEYILKEIKHRPYKGYLLMDIDLPWEDDPLRDFPNERAHFMEVWEKELTLLKANYIKVSGLKEERFQNGLTALKNLLLARSQTDNK